MDESIPPVTADELQAMREWRPQLTDDIRGRLDQMELRLIWALDQRSIDPSTFFGIMGPAVERANAILDVPWKPLTQTGADFATPFGSER